MEYRDCINDIKPAEFEAETLALKLNQVFALYEAARKRAALSFRRYP